MVVKLKKQPDLVRPLSSIRSYNHYLTLTSTGRWTTLGNYRSFLHGGSYFTTGFVCSARNIKLENTQPSHGTSSKHGRVEPRIFISCTQRISRKAVVGLEPKTSRSAVARVLPLDQRTRISISNYTIKECINNS